MRKDLRRLQLAIHPIHMEFQKLAQENTELLGAHPYREKVGKEFWSHPLSHYVEIIDKDFSELKKLLERIYDSLPKIKVKKDAKVKEPKKTRARQTAGKSGKVDPEAGNKTRKPRGGAQPASEPLERKVRKVRSDKGRRRSSGS